MLKYVATYTPTSGADRRPRTVIGTVGDTSAPLLRQVLEAMGLTNIVIDGLTEEEEELLVIEFDDDEFPEEGVSNYPKSLKVMRATEEVDGYAKEFEGNSEDE